MATVLFAWELGGGLGHLSQMFPLAQELARRGHRVVGVVRDVSGAAKGFGEIGAELFQAPAKLDARIVFPDSASFGQFLANMGFWNRDELAGLTAAWRNLFRLIRPDLIVFDHSPMALLAARGMECRKATIGSGFCCPPDVFPLPRIRANGKCGVEHEYSPAKIAEHEVQILERVNAVLRRWEARPLERLGQLYGEVNEVFLTTFAELDHYGEREGARYWGPVNGTGGKRPQWPVGSGKRIFAYLKAFSALPNLLEALKKSGHSTLIYSQWINLKTQRQFESESLRFVAEPLDMSIVGRECDLAILNAGHGATCDILLAGKPILQIPLNPEQQLIADAVGRMGAGKTASAKYAESGVFEQLIEELLGDGSYAAAARSFADRHADFDLIKQREEMLKRAVELL